MREIGEEKDERHPQHDKTDDVSWWKAEAARLLACLRDRDSDKSEAAQAYYTAFVATGQRDSRISALEAEVETLKQQRSVILQRTEEDGESITELGAENDRLEAEVERLRAVLEKVLKADMDAMEELRTIGVPYDGGLTCALHDEIRKVLGDEA